MHRSSAGKVAFGALLLLAVGATGACSYPDDFIQTSWTQSIELTDAHPVAVRILEADVRGIPDSTHDMPEYPVGLTLLQTNITADVDPPWISLIDISAGPSTVVSEFERVEGDADLTPVCPSRSCSRLYAVVTRWPDPVASGSKRVDLSATLRVSHRGAADQMLTVGPVQIGLSEDTSRRFDGKPRTISARATGTLAVAPPTYHASTTLSLQASSTLTGQLAFPLATELFTVFKGPNHVHAAIQVGSAKPNQIGLGMAEPIETGWSDSCVAGRDCTVPLTIDGDLPSCNCADDSPRPTETYTVEWSTEVRVELLSTTGELPGGSFQLTPST